MKKKPLSISQICEKGKKNLKKLGSKWRYPPDSNVGASVRINRKYLDSLFFEPKFLDPVEVDTSCTFFGVSLKIPMFCSPISQVDFMSVDGLVEIAKGAKNAGALMMLGIGGSSELQRSIDIGAPVIKIVKPYRSTEMIYKKVQEAEERGCVAVGMDIDYFYGRLEGDQVSRDELFGPQSSEVLKEVISQTKLPFIIKGVLSISDAERAVALGASAIIVSNHGSSAVDFTVPSMVALPKVADSVGDKSTVFIDTGFKTGNDILKALAFGAKAVGFASSMILAFAADGSMGVELLINQITAELRRTMAAVGCANLGAVKRSIISEMPIIWE